MPIALDNESTATASATQISNTHTCTGTGTNGILIVTVQATDSALGDRTISTVTHNNETCTHLPADADSVDDGLRTEIWYRLNPTTGGTPDVVVTAGGKCTDLTFGAASFTGVDTTTLFSNIYHLDASDSGPTDNSGVWSDDGLAFNGDDSDYASSTATPWSSVYWIEATGTNAPSSGGTIKTVRVRFKGYSDEGASSNLGIHLYDGANILVTNRLVGETPAQWSLWEELSVPSGGWSWAKVQSLRARTSLSYAGSVSELRVYKIEVEVNGGCITQTAVGSNTDPTLSITTEGASSWVVDSLSSGESGGTGKITAAHTSDGSPIHETDVGGDFHAAQFVDAGGAGAQTMNWIDTDDDTDWALSAVAIQVAAAAAARRVFVTHV